MIACLSGSASDADLSQPALDFAEATIEFASEKQIQCCPDLFKCKQALESLLLPSLLDPNSLQSGRFGEKLPPRRCSAKSQ